MDVFIMPRISSNRACEPNPGCMESWCVVGHAAPFTPHATRSSSWTPDDPSAPVDGNLEQCRGYCSLCRDLRLQSRALGSFPIGKPRWSGLECHDEQKQERDREKRDAVDRHRKKQHELQD